MQSSRDSQHVSRDLEDLSRDSVISKYSLVTRLAKILLRASDCLVSQTVSTETSARWTQALGDVRLVF